MRLGGLSWLGILAALAIIALLCVHLFAQSATGAPGVGAYQNAISQAENSVAQQDAAAAQAQSSAAQPNTAATQAQSTLP